ncbi:MAG: DUF362 domain-containing protein [Clostridia bacterium]|nr:DUF362 domain-containing protein [Clostridia bacterium]
MASEILFSSVLFDRYDADATLPAKFGRMLSELLPEDAIRGRTVAVKMHLGRNIGYSTIHPMFVKILIDRLKALGGKVFITDQLVGNARARGYTEEYLGCPIVPACGCTEKYAYERTVDYKTFHHVDVAGHIADADVLVNLSHVKGHGVCGYGGAVKNIAMGCVSTRTRHEIHGLEGGIYWDAAKCLHCDACIANCNHDACHFDENGVFKYNFHDCTLCQHCVKSCPTGAITATANQYRDFQTGMALCTQKCLEHFGKGDVFYINFLTNMTILCDCWGFTTPNIVPDIGICAGTDIVAIEQACLDLIRVEDFLPAGVPVGYEMGTEGHLLQRIHGKDPFIQLEELERIGMGSREYELHEIK